MNLSTRIIIGREGLLFSALLLVLMNPFLAIAQIRLDAQAFEALGNRSSDEAEQFADIWVNTEVSKSDRVATATTLATIVAENPEFKTYDRLIRMLGRRVEPEFTRSVLAKIESASDPLARGGLLHLLREATPATADAIANWLSDTRPGEDLVEESKKLPKLRESMANGAVAFRVCDIAFNVMQEVRATNGARARKLTRSQSIEARDGHITQARGGWATPDATPDVVKSQPLPTNVPPPSQLPKQPSEAKPTLPTPSEEPASSTPWSIIVVLLVAAGCLLWLLLKRRS